MVERRQLTDEHIALWREGCALLAAMTPDECAAGSERYRAFLQIDKKLTWRLVGPHSESLFSNCLNDPADVWSSPQYARYIDWPTAKIWRNALIDATGIAPGNVEK